MPWQDNPFYTGAKEQKQKNIATAVEGLGSLFGASDPMEDANLMLAGSKYRQRNAQAMLDEDTLGARGQTGDIFGTFYGEDGKLAPDIRQRMTEAIPTLARAGWDGNADELLGMVGAYSGDDALARSGMIGRGISPSENFAVDAGRADQISARDAGEARANALAVAGARPPSLNERLGDAFMQLSPEEQKQVVLSGRKPGTAGKAPVVGPNGRPLPAGQNRLFEYQAKVAGYANRAKTANDRFGERLGDDPGVMINPYAEGAQAIPVVGNLAARIIRTPEQEVLFNDASEFIRAKLRKESGAQITTQEWETEYPLYFPVAGDSDETIANKADLRAIVIDSVIKESNGGYEYLFGGDPSADNPDASAGADDGAGLGEAFAPGMEPAQDEFGGEGEYQDGDIVENDQGVKLQLQQGQWVEIE